MPGSCLVSPNAIGLTPGPTDDANAGVDVAVVEVSTSSTRSRMLPRTTKAAIVARAANTPAVRRSMMNITTSRRPPFTDALSGNYETLGGRASSCQRVVRN